MKIKTIARSVYCITGPKKEGFNHFKSKRIVRPSPEYKCWKWNRVYDVIFDTEQDYKDLFDFAKTEYRYDVDVSHVLSYLSKTYFKGKKLLLRKECAPKAYYWQRNYEDEMHYIVCINDDAIQLTDISPEEQKRWDHEKEVENNKKIIDNFCKENINAICKKYGMCVHQYYSDKNPNISFTDKYRLIQFLTKCIEDTVIKDLKALGLDVEQDETAIEVLVKSVWNTGVDLLSDKGIVVNTDKLEVK